MDEIVIRLESEHTQTYEGQKAIVSSLLLEQAKTRVQETTIPYII